MTKAEMAAATRRLKAIPAKDLQCAQKLERTYDDAEIAAFAKAIDEAGGLQYHPLVRRTGTGWGYVAGKRRVLAEKARGKKLIICEVLPDGMEEWKYDLIEIDENFQRRELSTAERDVWTAARIAAIPSKEREGAGRPKKGAKELSPDSGDNSLPKKGKGAGGKTDAVASTAKATGESRSKVEERRARHKAITAPEAGGEDAYQDIVNTPLNNEGDLNRLAEIAREDPVAAKDIIADAKAGKAVDTKAAVKKVKPERKETKEAETPNPGPPPPDPQTAVLKVFANPKATRQMKLLLPVVDMLPVILERGQPTEGRALVVKELLDVAIWAACEADEGQAGYLRAAVQKAKVSLRIV